MNKQPTFDRPSITSVIEHYVDLQPVGRELRGVCPLHSEKTPSFYVNEEKGVFHCYGCQEGGDVIAFVMKAEGVDFKGAIARLGLTGAPHITRPRKSVDRETAEIITAWAEQMSLAIGDQMRNLGRQAQIAQAGLSIDGSNKTSLKAEIGSSRQQWIILGTLDDDLANPQFLPELWKERQTVEVVVNGN